MAKLINLIPNSSKKQVNEETALDRMDVALPAKIERFLDRTIGIIKGYNLPRKKEELVIAKVIDSLGLSTSELQRAVLKLKKYGIVTRKKTGNADADWLGEGKENLNEAKLSKLDDGVANLYSYSGIKTKYSDNAINMFGQDVVDKAIKMAPKIIAYKKKLKQIVKDIEGSDESKILMAMIGHGRGYGGGSSSPANISDLFKLN